MQARLKTSLWKRAVGRKQFYAGVGAALIGLWLVIYRDFVFGPKVLLFGETGSDSLNVFYPFYLLLSDYLHEVGMLSWSFRLALGQDLFPHFGNLVVAPIIWLPKRAISTALIYQDLLYTVLTGVLFARFLRSRGLCVATCVLGALLLSFSGYMTAGSCWYFQAQEVVCFTLLLLATEAAVVRGRWIFLPLVVVAVALLGSFHLFVCAIFLSFYVPFRLIERFSWQPAALIRRSALIAAAAFLGVGLSGFFSLDNFYALVNSPRGSGLTSMVGRLSVTPPFSLDRPELYITMALRPFGNDMAGTEDDFRGWYNYFESPMVYCGLICLVLFPQIFATSSFRRRVLYGSFMALIIWVGTFPWFRHLLWGFQGEYFRTLSLFAVFFVITLSMTALSRYMCGARYNFWILGMTVLLLFGMLHFPNDELQWAIYRPLEIPVTIFLIAYLVLALAGQLARKQRLAGYVMILLAGVELAYLNGKNIANRHGLTKPQLQERIGYNDETVDIMRDLKGADPGFFRVTKLWGSSPTSGYPSLNDSMVFGYYGTSAYSSFNNVNYTEFLIAVGTITNDNIDSSVHWSAGLMGHSLLSIFACEKYVLTRDPVPYQMSEAYEYVRRYENTHLFRDRYPLPLGLNFNRYLPESVFLQMPESIKTEALLFGVVLSDEAAKEAGLPLYDPEQFKNSVLSDNPVALLVACAKNGLSLRSFKEKEIVGTLTSPEKSVLVMQTPYDPGWRVFEDGHPVPVFKADVGLLGAALHSGRHEVVFRYTPPFLVRGAIISGVCLLLVLFAFRRWPHLTFRRRV
jgi:Bacterial membrane protein YfhO